jgi:hypothetical protein
VKGPTQSFRDAKEISEVNISALVRQEKRVPVFVVKESANEKTLYYSNNYDCGMYEYIVPCFELWHTKTKL